VEEGQVVFELTFPADAQSSKLLQPSEGAFDWPALRAQPTARFAAFGNFRAIAEPF